LAPSPDFAERLAAFASTDLADLWPGQKFVLDAYAADHLDTADLAIEMPTGDGKTPRGIADRFGPDELRAVALGVQLPGQFGVQPRSALQLGHVEDKQWVAVNHIVGNRFQDHVYAAWAVFNGQSIKVRMAVSRDRGQTFDRPVTISAPSDLSAGATCVIPQIDAAGTVYVSVVSFPLEGRRRGAHDLCRSLDR
jgi:hypothetical protein